MDLSKITDEKELKSLAYDQMGILQTAERNLQMIQTRLKQLQEATQKPDEGSVPKEDEPK